MRAKTVTPFPLESSDPSGQMTLQGAYTLNLPETKLASLHIFIFLLFLIGSMYVHMNVGAHRSQKRL